MANKICELLLDEVFGDQVAKVGRELMTWNGQTLRTLLRSGDVQVKKSLACLIQHNIVSFAKNPDSPKVEYTFHQDNCLNLIR